MTAPWISEIAYSLSLSWNQSRLLTVMKCMTAAAAYDYRSAPQLMMLPKCQYLSVRRMALLLAGVPWVPSSREAYPLPLPHLLELELRQGRGICRSRCFAIRYHAAWQWRVLSTSWCEDPDSA